MKTSTAILLAIGTAGAGFVLARLLFHSGPDGVVEHRPVDSALQIPTFDPPVKPAGPEPPELEMPDSRVPVLTERPPDPAPPVMPTEKAKPVASIDSSDPRTLPESTLAEMKVKQDAVQDYLLERTTPLLMQRLDDGLAEKVADGDTWSNPDYEQMRTTIYAVQKKSDQPGWYRAVLPREQYPELYAYKDEVYRLENAVREREIAELLKAQESAASRR